MRGKTLFALVAMLFLIAACVQIPEDAPLEHKEEAPAEPHVESIDAPPVALPPAAAPAAPPTTLPLAPLPKPNVTAPKTPTQNSTIQYSSAGKDSNYFEAQEGQTVRIVMKKTV